VNAIMKERKRAEGFIGQATASWDHNEYGNLSDKERTAIGNFLLERHTPRGSKSSDRQAAIETKIEESVVEPQASPPEPLPAAAPSSEICPRCESALILRTAKKGKNAGNQFYGCSRYPKCRFTKDL